jgi:hypothetical protein
VTGAIANAVCDALAVFRAEFNAMPIKPGHIVKTVAGGDGMGQDV